MRVTGGAYSRRNVKCPPGVIRPAMDRMRESVFAVLGDLTGISFLDLYSGSGIIGIEAASRGAARITFVESDRRKIPVLRENCSFVEAKISIAAVRAERFLRSCRSSYDVIFADPPFAQKNKQMILELVSRHHVLNKDGVFLIHYPEEDRLPDVVEAFSLVDRRTYGRSIVNFYRSIAFAHSFQRSQSEEEESSSSSSGSSSSGPVESS